WTSTPKPDRSTTAVVAPSWTTVPVSLEINATLPMGSAGWGWFGGSGSATRFRTAGCGHRSGVSVAAGGRSPYGAAAGLLMQGSETVGPATAPQVADGQGQGVGGVGRFGWTVQGQDPGDHLPDLRLVRPA